jgi:hypothetical protein
MGLSKPNIHIKNYLKDFNKRQTIIITQKNSNWGAWEGFVVSGKYLFLKPGQIRFHTGVNFFFCGNCNTFTYQ